MFNYIYNRFMLILTGASASGKTVTALDLQKRYGLVKAITTTTRQIRDGEKDGVDYFFVSEEEFEKRLKDGKFVESSLYNNNYYGCGIDQIADNKVVVLDPNGLHSFIALNNKHVVSFLLVCDKSIREARMHSRGDKLDKIAERLKNDVNDFSLERIGKVDFIINTDNKTINQVTDEIYKLYLTRIG